MSPAEQLTLWADRLRDMAVLGLYFARSEADRTRYETIAQAALELWAVATGRSPEELDARRGTLFAAPTPHTRAQAVILEGNGVWLAPDARHGWALPSALYRLPDDSPSSGVARVAAALTGLEVEVTALTGLYDSPPAAGQQAYHAYDYVFAAQRRGGNPLPTARRFALNDLPALSAAHQSRLDHALRVAHEGAAAHFTFSPNGAP